MNDSDCTPLPQLLASDNYSGICPGAWTAMATANRGHPPAYGDDAWTARASDAFRELFETDCEVFFAFNGTAANSLALASLCQSYHDVICAESAHVETDECGVPEFFSNGSKLLVARSEDGKLIPPEIRGNVYLRKILVRSARAAVLRIKRDKVPIGAWLDRLDSRAPKNVVVVAMANKLARIAWAVLSSGE
jgi:threonine aldolase